MERLERWDELKTVCRTGKQIWNTCRYEEATTPLQADCKNFRNFQVAKYTRKTRMLTGVVIKFQDFLPEKATVVASQVVGKAI